MQVILIKCKNSRAKAREKQVPGSAPPTRSPKANGFDGRSLPRTHWEFPVQQCEAGPVLGVAPRGAQVTGLTVEVHFRGAQLNS